MYSVNDNSFVTSNQFKQESIDYNGVFDEAYHDVTGYQFNDDYVTADGASELYDLSGTILEVYNSSSYQNNEKEFIKAKDVKIFDVTRSFLKVTSNYDSVNDLIPGGSGSVIYQDGIAPTIKISYV